MAEYIEKQDIYDAIDLLMTRFPYKVPGRPDTYQPYNEAWADACSHVLDIIRRHQPADVRSVVLCKDCVMYRRDKELAEASYLDPNYYCGLLQSEMPEDGFCSYGKRRGGDAE